MAIIMTDDKHYSDIANMLRELNGSDHRYKPEDMADAIDTTCTEACNRAEETGIKIGKEQGYNEGFVDGEEEGYDTGYIDGWDFGESSGTHDGYEVGVGFAEDTKKVVCFSGYESRWFSGSYQIALDNPKQLIVSVSGECSFVAFKLTDAEGTSYTLDITELNAETYTVDIPDDFVCNADKGYGTLYLEGQCDDYGIVGVSVTNKLGYDEGVEDGADARDLEWWATYQDIDNKNSGWYHFMFAGSNWNKETFKPRFDIKCHSPHGGANGAQMFYMHNRYAGEPYDLVEHLEELGVVLDFSRFAALVSVFQYANISRVGIIDITAISSSYGTYFMFASSYIETIDKIIMCERTFDYYNNEFSGATALKNITIEGVIANNKLNFSACPLTHESLMSIINHLKDFSGTGETRSITFGATNLAKLSDSEKAVATQKGWTLL